MRHTYSSHIITELKSSGFDFVKCPVDKEWQIQDKGDILFRSRSLGDLAKKAGKEFGIEWK